MALNYTVTEDLIVILKNGTKKVNEVGPWDSAEGAELWGTAICEKYNSEEYKGINYPNETETL